MICRPLTGNHTTRTGSSGSPSRQTDSHRWASQWCGCRPLRRAFPRRATCRWTCTTSTHAMAPRKTSAGAHLLRCSLVNWLDSWVQGYMPLTFNDPSSRQSSIKDLRSHALTLARMQNLPRQLVRFSTLRTALPALLHTSLPSRRKGVSSCFAFKLASVRILAEWHWAGSRH
jgi:hypothetical protein